MTEEQPWNKEYRELVTPEVSALLWDVIGEARSAGWEVTTSSRLLHEGAKDLGRAMRDRKLTLTPEAARNIARQIVLPYAWQVRATGWW